MFMNKIINCEFVFKCPLKWENLEKTQNEDRKYCKSCQKNVYFAHSQSELNELARVGKCAAFSPPEDHSSDGNIPEPNIPTTMGMVVPPTIDIPPTVDIPPPIQVTYQKKSPWWKFWE
jgi:hypothetical protein